MNEDLIESLKVLEEGGTILYPTDTIWGIGCDATNTKAIEKIYAIKQRHQSKSLIILLDHEIKLARYVEDIPDIAYDLIDYSDKPLTIIYKRAKNLPANLINEDGSIAIRILKDKFCNNLISRFKKPIVSTSANISTQKSPSNFHEINEKIKLNVDYVVKWRQDETQYSIASSIIKLESNGIFKIIRK
ncbi:MAG: threonylcarbamoyl-AMP synthase [Chlorobi bacterium]|nr:threonylcarbamoyl-AMP synthase [Chlorobiota bacterium]